ncbi:MAG: CRISPR-associated protein Cas5 [Lachnospiraceae bacterium]|nr:CRISPR-associated protein Cas5 [Lachnospiraceae bacterium]
MKALRIKLHQTSANYRKAETVENRMTYPLPPISTVIGALHGICGYTEYKKMDVSIQGKFASMHKEPYVDYCFLNSTMDDRGDLVKMKNETMLSNAFVKVAHAKKSQGNSFLNGITIQVYDEELLAEYRELRALGSRIAAWKSTEFKAKLQEYKEKKAELAARKKEIGKGNSGFSDIVQEEKKIKEEEKQYKERATQYEEEHYKKPISRFRTVTKIIRYYEILDDIELVLHVSAEEGVLNDIYENIYNLKSLGRSEDFVNVEEISLVDLLQEEKQADSSYSSYLRYDDVRDEKIFTGVMSGRDFSGTKYYLGKQYEIRDGKRIFSEKVKVIYTSNYGIDETSEHIWIDKWNRDGKEGKYIVNFL